MKKKRYFVFSLLSCLGLSSLGIASAFSNGLGQNVFGVDCDHSGNHYASTSKYVEFWTCCKCNETFLTNPGSGTFVDNDPANMVGGVPSIALIGKGIDNLPSTIGTLTNFEKVKNSNILYTLNNKISKLSDEDKAKLDLDKFNAAKLDYDLYVTPIFGFNDKDTLTPLSDSQITSVTKIDNETYGEMLDATFEENAATKNHGILLNNLSSSFASFESISLIAINDLYAWGGKDGGYADKVNFQNNYKEIVSSNLPGYLVDDGYGNGVGFAEFKFTSTTTFADPIINYQNTWGPADNGHTHFYFTGLFGINSVNLQSMADEVTSLINKATSLKLTSNEIAAQATLLVNEVKSKYESLPESAKSLVTNYSDLETLEATLTSYTTMLETTSFSLKHGDDVYSNFQSSTRFDEEYGNVTHIKCKEEVSNAVSISFNFSIGAEYLKGYSKIIVFLRSPNLTSGISGTIDCGDPYLWLSTGTIKDSWVANSDQDLKASENGQSVNGLRLLNIIPAWATGYGELEFTSFVLIKDGATYSALH